MTASSDFMSNDIIRALEPARMVDGGRLIMRGLQRMLGVALTLAAVGIWIAPGASWESDIMLFKLVLSLTALLAGLGIMQTSRKAAKPEVEIDTIRREVRVVRMGASGAPILLQRCPFGDLSRAEQDGNHVRMFGPDKNLLAEVTLTSRATLVSLITGLHNAGKLV